MRRSDHYFEELLSQTTNCLQMNKVPKTLTFWEKIAHVDRCWVLSRSKYSKNDRNTPLFWIIRLEIRDQSSKFKDQSLLTRSRWARGTPITCSAGWVFMSDSISCNYNQPVLNFEKLTIFLIFIHSDSINIVTARWSTTLSHWWNFNPHEKMFISIFFMILVKRKFD